MIDSYLPYLPTKCSKLHKKNASFYTNTGATQISKVNLPRTVIIIAMTMQDIITGLCVQSSRLFAMKSNEQTKYLNNAFYKYVPKLRFILSFVI